MYDITNEESFGAVQDWWVKSLSDTPLFQSIYGMMQSQIPFLNNERKRLLYIWHGPRDSLVNQIYQPEKFVTPISFYTFLLCSVCQSFVQGLIYSSRRRSRPSWVTRTITVTKGPKVCHLPWFIHSNCRQGWQKSGFWVEIPAPEPRRLCHFPRQWLHLLTMTVLIKELLDMICIGMVSFRSWQSNASTCVAL